MMINQASSYLQISTSMHVWKHLCRRTKRRYNSPFNFMLFPNYIFFHFFFFLKQSKTVMHSIYCQFLSQLIFFTTTFNWNNDNIHECIENCMFPLSFCRISAVQLGMQQGHGSMSRREWVHYSRIIIGTMHLLSINTPYSMQSHHLPLPDIFQFPFRWNRASAWRGLSTLKQDRCRSVTIKMLRIIDFVIFVFFNITYLFKYSKLVIFKLSIISILF